MNALNVLADEINREHALARTSAENAIQHAIRCGRLLNDQKKALPHGAFQSWVARACAFEYPTAARYMKAARESQISTPVEISTLSALFPSGRKPKPRVTDRPDAAAAPIVVKPINSKPQSPPDADQLCEPDAEEEAAQVVFEREYTASLDKIMSADDKLAAAHADIKRQAAYIGVLESVRDGLIGSKDAITKLLKAEQRKTERLQKELDRANADSIQLRNDSEKLKEENESLRERIAIMTEGEA